MPRPRLPRLTPPELDPDQRAVHEAILHGRRSSGSTRWLADEEGRLEGPFNAMLYGPRIGLALQGVGAAVRYESSLTPRCRELAILEVARLRQSQFEWLAHEEAARAAGMSEAEIERIRSGTPSESFSPDEQLARACARQLVADRDLDDATLEQAVEQLGLVGTNELVVLVGYYDLLALSLRVWGVTEPSRPG